jgi:hypothetical protein
VRADAKAAAQEKPNEGDDMNTGTSGSLAERQAFEKWLGRESFTERSDSGKYVSAHVDAMWSAWSARAVLAAPQNTQDHLAVPPVEAPAFSWHCTSEDDYPTGQVSTSPLGNGDVALTFGNDAKANARFIANAPRVYAALQALVTGLAANDEEGLIEHAEVMQEARSALAAAPKE